jgi:hypothetical protein
MASGFLSALILEGMAAGLLTLDVAISAIRIASPDKLAGTTGLVKGVSAFRMTTGILGWV